MACENCNACQPRVSLIRLIVRILVGAFTLFVGLLNSSKALIAAKIDATKVKKENQLQ